MTAEVKLEVIIEALEMADDSISSYLDVQAGEVHAIMEEELDLAEEPETAIADLPNWHREVVEVARGIQEHDGKRFPGFTQQIRYHEWAIMDYVPPRLTETDA
jgi:hypothetical protein